MLFAILAIWFGYKKGRDTGRNPFLWAAICGSVFVGLQMLVAVGAGVMIAFGVEFADWDESLYDTYSWLISLITVVISFVGLFFIFRFLDRHPRIEPSAEPPLPPTFFDDEGTT
ncbi:MAG: hypothetical protein K1X36_06505 [Pyrinomonadaceae bacterium]|nr:hypothetical protein [Pyrinomonadaceae bacterium]